MTLRNISHTGITLFALAFFITSVGVPVAAHAQIPGMPQPVIITAEVAPTAIGRTIQTAVNTIKNTISSIATVTTSVSAVALQIDKYVLEPIAFVTSGNLLKAITAGVLNFVSGGTNGTGKPQFVQDLRGYMRNISDNQAGAFLNSFNRNSNSPFASAITSSLYQNYQQDTSLAGFFAANQDTLSQFSPNPQQFLAGDWSQGGVSAWFALTTQSQNNPYILHQRAQQELFALVSGETSSKLTQLNWGQGFLSWCGAPDASTQAVSAPVAGGTLAASLPSLSQNSDGSYSASSPEPCTNKDGTAGIIKTPGSVIKAELDKALGLNWDKLVQMGNVGPEINTILGNVASVMNTINFASDLLGGGSSGGLAGVGQPSGSGSGPSALSQYQTGQGYLGVTQSTINKGAAALPSSGASMASRVDQYEAAWSAISGSATLAGAAVQSLAGACNTQASAAQSALVNEIQPIQQQVQTASTTIANARAMIAKVQAELTSNADGNGGAYTSDVQTLQTMPPTVEDLAKAQQDALVTNAAQATPSGSLSVSGSSVVDQMNLIVQNAAALKSACLMPVIVPTQ